MRRILLALFVSIVATSAQAAPESPWKIVGHIALPDGGWDYASYDADARRIYLGRPDGVLAVEVATRAVTARLIEGSRVHGVAIVPGAGLAVATNGADNSALLFETATGKLLARIPTGTKPDAVLYDPATRLVAVLNGGGDITLIDPHQQTSAGTIAIGGTLEFAVADGSGTLWVNIEDKAELVAVDLKTRRARSATKLINCEGPTGLAFATAEHMLVSVCKNGRAVITDSNSGKVRADIAIGKRPDAAIYDAARHQVLVPCGEGVLSVISFADPQRPRVIATVPTQPGARTGTLAGDGRLYLPVAKFTPDPAGGRPKPVPGSTELLVLGHS
ncbi:MAG: gluconolactonase [Rhodospirillales bacterium]|nr:gluconolactonase [Rhodospirillales bacterium]